MYRKGFCLKAFACPLKYRSSKAYVFLFSINTVFPMFDRHIARFAACGYMNRLVRGTWNFVCNQATLVQGCTSEAQMNTDVNLCRLPDEVHILAEILSAPYRRMRYPQTTDSAMCQSKQRKDSLSSRKTYA